MSHYNPADDPVVVNGIKEAYGFKMGDIVEYTNSYGLKFGPHSIVGFVQNPDPGFLPDNTVYIDSDSPWFPVKPCDLRKITADEVITNKAPEPLFVPKRRKNASTGGEETEMVKLEFLGFDDWDRPVYQDESGKLWKDVNLGNGEPALYSVSDNDFEGEPDMPFSNGNK